MITITCIAIAYYVIYIDLYFLIAFSRYYCYDCHFCFAVNVNQPSVDIPNVVTLSLAYFRTSLMIHIRWETWLAAACHVIRQYYEGNARATRICIITRIRRAATAKVRCNPGWQVRNRILETSRVSELLGEQDH